MKSGDLVQVLPAKIGYYIVLGRTKMERDYVGRTVYWDLWPLPSAGFDQSGLGLIVEIQCDPTKRSPSCEYKVHWINPPTGCPPYSWNSKSWLEKVNE